VRQMRCMKSGRGPLTRVSPVVQSPRGEPELLSDLPALESVILIHNSALGGFASWKNCTVLVVEVGGSARWPGFATKPPPGSAVLPASGECGSPSACSAKVGVRYRCLRVALSVPYHAMHLAQGRCLHFTSLPVTSVAVSGLFASGLTYVRAEPAFRNVVDACPGAIHLNMPANVSTSHSQQNTIE